MPATAPKYLYSQKYKTRRNDRPHRHHQMVHVTIIGVAYRQRQ
jgi:hypothetical protein